MIRFNFILILFFLSFNNNKANALTRKDSILLTNYWNRVIINSADSKGNFLYCGIDNNLKLQYPDTIIDKNNIFLGVNNGEIFKTKAGYFTIPQFAGRSFITTYYINEFNDTMVIGKKQFIVLQVPSPKICVGKTVIKDKDICDRKLFLTTDSLNLFFTDDLPGSEKWFKIEHFTVGYFYGGTFISSENTGSRLSAKTLQILRKLNPGQEVVIKVNTITKSQVVTYLPLVKFKVR